MKKKLLLFALAALTFTPAAALADDDKDEKDHRTMADEVHELHTRAEEAIDKGFEAAGNYVEQKSQESHSGCNNDSLGSRTREAMGCN